MQTAPEIPEPFARTDKSAPCQGRNPIIDATPGTNQVTLRRGRTLSTTLHLSLRDNLSEERVDLEGLEPSPATMTGCYAANYTTGPRIRAYFSCDRDSGLDPAFIEAEFRFGTGFRQTHAWTADSSCLASLARRNDKGWGSAAYKSYRQVSQACNPPPFRSTLHRIVTKCQWFKWETPSSGTLSLVTD
jgi:hypothetical protein